MAACYTAADAFVLASSREPYGTVYGEAMAAGLPVVGYAAGNLPHPARHGEEGEMVLRISDTGVGIAEEDLGTIFQKFRQGGNTLADGDAMTREYSGTGLGLSIVQELCKLLGGGVSTESRLGKGSTFTVRLPWTLVEQPRLDWPVSDEFEQFTKVRPDLIRGAGG